MSLKRRLEKLEVTQEKLEAVEHYVFDPNGTRPRDLDHRLYFKMTERRRARVEGLEMLLYTREEIEHMREEDLEIARREGVVAELRGAPGWQTAQAQEMLDEWESAARRRLELTENLSRELWYQVYEEHDVPHSH